MGAYYDGTKLLSLLDINGNKPEIYICTTNRTGGKTTFFNRLAVNRWKKNGDKFALLFRYNYELDDVADKFFKDIGALFFRDYELYSVRRARGIYHELWIKPADADEGEPGEMCGYALAINNADALKKYSHMFSDVQFIIFDEFQSETNHYCPQEVRKFISIHTSIARGRGMQYRYVPVYMLGNPITLLNPYYSELGINTRLREDTKFLRGDGYVLEQGYVDSAALAQKESAFNRAFASNSYVAYSSQGVYLNDSKAFIEKLTGLSRYLVTLRYNGADYAVREFSEQGLIYCDDHPDRSFPTRLAVTTDDHQINYVMLKKNEMFFINLRYFFDNGCFRFKDLRCKEVIMKALAYI